ncbi:AtpZ/AtpI family protein [bacterium]|nr:AtpZ/AtpI family protein [bacterium]
MKGNDLDQNSATNSNDQDVSEGIGVLSQYIGLGIELPAAIAIGTFSGLWIGSFFGYRNTGALIGLCFGLAAAVRSFLRIIRL